jgi:hypothetical protein
MIDNPAFLDSTLQAHDLKDNDEVFLSICLPSDDKSQRDLHSRKSNLIETRMLSIFRSSQTLLFEASFRPILQDITDLRHHFAKPFLQRPLVSSSMPSSGYPMDVAQCHQDFVWLKRSRDGVSRGPNGSAVERFWKIVIAFEFHYSMAAFKLSP